MSKKNGSYLAPYVCYPSKYDVEPSPHSNRTLIDDFYAIQPKKKCAENVAKTNQNFYFPANVTHLKEKYMICSSNLS